MMKIMIRNDKDKQEEEAKIKPIKPAPAVDEDEDEEDETEKEKEKENPPKQKREPVKAKDPEPEPEPEVKIENEEEESESDDDGGLSDWLLSIGFKKKKLALMLKALSELGLDTMEDLETLLIDLYKNSYGNQQKQFMDKLQNDILEQGIKYAQWIRFSTKAQAMIEMKVKQQQMQQNGVSDDDDLLQSADKGKVTKGGDYNLMGVGANIKGLPQNNGFIVMQSEEAQQLENLRNAMSMVYSGIDNLDNLVLQVENNEKLAMESVEKEFNNLLKQIENRKNILLSSIAGVGEDKSSMLGKQNTELRSIAEYEETMANFNQILADNQNIRGRNEISVRTQRLSNLVYNVLSKHGGVNMTPSCTPLIGFHCNITPIVLELNKLGVVTWGNPPSIPFINGIITTDWSIMVEYGIKENRHINVLEDPIVAYEIQCVLCKNEENLLWNFQYELEKKRKR